MNDRKFGMNIAIDMSEDMKNIERDLKRIAQNRITSLLQSHFRDNKEYIGNKIEHIQGPGTQELQEMLAKKFVDLKTVEFMERYFNNNFERLLEESMEKAIRHRANKFAFSKIGQIDEALKKL